MTTLYDLYAFTNVYDASGSNSTYEQVAYLHPSPTIDYPCSNTEATFGPIFTPKVWANEISTLELASSGKVVFSLSNEHALDLTELNDVVYLACWEPRRGL